MSAHERTIETVEARAVENRDLGAGFRLMRLEAPAVASRARAGQFLTLGMVGRTDPLLPRPFAFFDVDRGSGEVHVLYKIIGRGTRILAELPRGGKVRLTGPLGRGWRKPEGAEEGTAVLVAGGTAWAALHLLAKELAAGGAPVRAIWGGACEESFPDREAVAPPGVRVILSTDDGSCGFRGTAVECLCDLESGDTLRAEPSTGTPRSPSPGEGHPPVDASKVSPLSLYGAGPVPMLEALAGFARGKGLPCQVSLEARMACGIGVCRGCVVNARRPHPETGLRRRAVCADGPVFDAEELDWEELS